MSVSAKGLEASQQAFDPERVPSKVVCDEKGKRIHPPHLGRVEKGWSISLQSRNPFKEKKRSKKNKTSRPIGFCKPCFLGSECKNQTALNMKIPSLDFVQTCF